MDFRGLVWKRVWKITFFGLKSGQDLKNRAAHPHVDFPGVPPPSPPGPAVKRGSSSLFTWSTAFYNIQQSELFELILCELTRWRSSETPRGHYIHGSNAWREERRCGVWGTSQQTTRKWQQRLHAYMFSLVSPAEQSLPVWRQDQNWKKENGCRFLVLEQGTCNTVQCHARLNAQKALFAVVVEQRSVQKNSVSVSSFCCPLLSTIHRW